MERRAWQAVVHGLAKSQTRLSTHSHSLMLAPTKAGRGSSQTLLRMWPPNHKTENFPVTQWLPTTVLPLSEKWCILPK